MFSFIHPIILIPPNKYSKFCYYLSKVLLQKEAYGYAKSYSKKGKKEKESIKKMDKCPRY
jgi:hypothetical protein